MLNHGTDYSQFLNDAHTTQNSFYNEEISGDELGKIINALPINKGPGNDQIHPKIIKLCKNELMDILLYLYNCILHQLHK